MKTRSYLSTVLLLALSLFVLSACSGQVAANTVTSTPATFVIPTQATPAPTQAPTGSLATPSPTESILPGATQTPLPIPTLIPQPTTAGTQRIIFPSGSDNYTLSTSLAQGVPQTYVLNGQQGQTLYVTRNGAVSVQVLAPDGSTLTDPNVQPGPWAVSLPATGDYSLVLSGAGNVSVSLYAPSLGQTFPLAAPLPDTLPRISFLTGDASQTLTVNLNEGIPSAYVLRILAGQTLYVTATGNVTLAVLDPSNLPLTPTTPLPGKWQVTLPQTGDYTLVFLGSGASTVVVYIPPA